MDPTRQVIESTEAIVHHLQEAGRTKQTVAGIELFFKVDQQDRVWLLYCSSMRLMHETPDLILQVMPAVVNDLRLGISYGER